MSLKQNHKKTAKENTKLVNNPSIFTTDVKQLIESSQIISKLINKWYISAGVNGLCYIHVVK